MLKAAIFAGLCAVSKAECPNGCNGHGKCTSYDMCICNRNWQANDCSERVCQFGTAHVDTPKGDLNMDGAISGPDTPVAVNSFNYPYGTPEQFPHGRDSDLNEVINSAHYYMECSNKGKCNRETGECECFDGYDGSACQRASCPGWPNVCSGHGVCKSIRQLAAADGDNVYELWDRHSTMGCECDEGFEGPDCSERKCKFGIDPLYYDDSTTIRYAMWDFAILAADNVGTNPFDDGMPTKGPATFALRFFDLHGEDWVTEPITYGASCATVTAALEALPNNVIPVGSLQCIKTFNDGTGGSSGSAVPSSSGWSVDDTTDVFSVDPLQDRSYYRLMSFWAPPDSNPEGEGIGSSKSPLPTALGGSVYKIKFAQNPGALLQPEIETYLDGTRPSINQRNGVITAVWTDGQQGESVDYFADYCAGVTVTLDYSKEFRGGTIAALSGLTAAETKLLKRCLGSADFDLSNNVDIYDWDLGSDDFPHLIKLVLTTASSNDGGYYAALRYWCTDSSAGGVDACEADSEAADTFILYNPFDQGPLFLYESDTNVFDVYTTKGTLARSSSHANVRFGFGSNTFYTYPYNPEKGIPIYGDLACEINDNNGIKVNYWTKNFPDEQTTCLNKTDIFTVFSPFGSASTGAGRPQNNPPQINLYTVKKIYQTQFKAQSSDPLANNFNGTYVIESDLNTNWAASVDDRFQVYKFFPSTESTYTYVAPCSNRGLCNHDTGLCECFHGYTNDDCSLQNSLSV